MRSMIGLAIVLLAMTGCASVVQVQPMPAVAPGGNGVAVDVAMFPECQAAAEFNFAGEGTLAALGLGDTVAGPDATRPAMIWVTAGPVPNVGPAGAGKGLEVGDTTAERVVCVQWSDGSGMMTTIPDEWKLPSDIGDGETASAAASSEQLNLGPIAVLVAVVVLLVASILAFRREDRGSTTGSSPG